MSIAEQMPLADVKNRLGRPGMPRRTPAAQPDDAGRGSAGLTVRTHYRLPAAQQSKSTTSQDTADIRPALDPIARGAVMYADRLAPAQPEAQVLHTDGRWHPATILARCRHRDGWAVLLHWSDGTEDRHRHDPARLIPAVCLGDDSSVR
jgi:hypothetical protein